MKPFANSGTGRRVTILGVSAALLCSGSTCREDVGEIDYSAQEGLVLDAGAPGRQPGTDPFEFGDRRLSFDRFYEGDFSESLAVDNETRFLFIFQEEFTAIFTALDPLPQIRDPLEGRFSNAVVHAGTNFWGFGIFFAPSVPQDLSSWTTMAVAFKSSDPVYEDINISMRSINQLGVETAVTLQASDYGYVNDGEWHPLRIPLADFVARDPCSTSEPVNCFSLDEIRSPFTVDGAGFGRGQILLVDELYFTGD